MWRRRDLGSIPTSGLRNLRRNGRRRAGLGAVGEVAELRFPQHQGMRLGQRIAVFEAQHRLFRQRAVDHLEMRLPGLDMVQRDAAVLAVLVGQHGVALRERAAADVLAGQTHRGALDQQRTEGQRLGCGPVDALAGLHHLLLLLQLAQDLAIGVEAVGNPADGVADLAQDVEFDAGRLLAHLLFAAQLHQAGPLALEPVGLVDLVALGRLEVLFQGVLESGHHAGNLVVAQHALTHQLLAVNLARGRVLRDLAIHQRLRERRLVRLVVAVAAIADHVHDHVGPELLAELGGDAGHVHHRFRIVAVDVEHRALEALGHVRRIGAGTRILRAGGEADLVVDDEMDRAAGGVALELRQEQRLRHHALAGEGGIAVQQDGHDLLAGMVAALGLLGPHLADHHRVDDL